MLEVSDLQSPEFFEIANKAKAVIEAKIKEQTLFVELVGKHKAKTAEFDAQLAALVAEYKAAKPDKPAEAVHAAK